MNEPEITMTTTFMAAHGGLRFEALPTGWTRCYLLKAEGEVFLGAESFYTFMGRLLVVLSGSPYPGHAGNSEQFHGYTPIAGFSLSERHFTICSVYHPNPVGEHLLLFIDGHNTYVWLTLSLSRAEVTTLHVVLAEFYLVVAHHLASN